MVMFKTVAVAIIKEGTKAVLLSAGTAAIAAVLVHGTSGLKNMTIKELIK